MPIWLLILLSVFTGVAGQISMKFGASSASVSDEIFSLSSTLFLILGSPWVLLGLMSYGLSAFCWVAVLSRADLSYVYPFAAIGYVLVTIAAKTFLHEAVPLGRWFGVAVICAGILIVARSAPQ